MPPQQLLAAGGIAAMLGVTATRADQLTRTKGFPDPSAEIDTGKRKLRAWTREDVEAWARATGRRS